MKVKMYDDQRYLVIWEENDTVCPDEIQLVLKPLQQFGRAHVETYRFAVYHTIDNAPVKLDASLPAGLYRYYLYNSRTHTELTDPRDIYFGKKKGVRILEEVNPDGFHQFRIECPFPLREGDCCLCYGPSLLYPLPAAQPVPEGYYVIAFTLQPHKEPGIKLCWSEDLKGIPDLPQRLEATYRQL